MKALTVNQLHKLCLQQKKLGNGKKKILITDDEEGNGYHMLFEGFDMPVVGSDEEGDRMSYFDVAFLGLPKGVKDEDLEEYILLS